MCINLYKSKYVGKVRAGVYVFPPHEVSRMLETRESELCRWCRWSALLVASQQNHEVAQPGSTTLERKYTTVDPKQVGQQRSIPKSILRRGQEGKQGGHNDGDKKENKADTMTNKKGDKKETKGNRRET